jgi:exosortase/archaeosortase family protein
VIANSFRVTMTGVLGEMNKEWASGLFHEAEGWLIFLISLAILAGVHRLINVAFTRLRASQ